MTTPRFRTLLAAVAFLSLGTGLPGSAQANAVTDLLRQYESAGASKFSASDAEAFWVKPALDAKSGEQRKCSQCHGEDLRRKGKHATTGKVIEPLAPSVNPKRLTEVAEIEKWFSRNCRWTLGRDCTAQEKGNVLVMLRDK
jgi:hypothetical protein